MLGAVRRVSDLDPHDARVETTKTFEAVLAPNDRPPSGSRTSVQGGQAREGPAGLWLHHLGPGPVHPELRGAQQLGRQGRSAGGRLPTRRQRLRREQGAPRRGGQARRVLRRHSQAPPGRGQHARSCQRLLLVGRGLRRQAQDAIQDQATEDEAGHEVSSSGEPSFIRSQPISPRPFL